MFYEDECQSVNCSKRTKSRHPSYLSRDTEKHKRQNGRKMTNRKTIVPLSTLHQRKGSPKTNPKKILRDRKGLKPLYQSFDLLVGAIKSLKNGVSDENLTQFGMELAQHQVNPHNNKDFLRSDSADLIQNKKSEIPQVGESPNLEIQKENCEDELLNVIKPNNFDQNYRFATIPNTPEFSHIENKLKNISDDNFVEKKNPA